MTSAISNNIIARMTRRAVCAGVLLSLAPAVASAEDQRCEQLVALHRQYAGVALTSEQQNLKRKLVAWYSQNCGGLRQSAGR